MAQRNHAASVRDMRERCGLNFSRQLVAVLQMRVLGSHLHVRGAVAIRPMQRDELGMEEALEQKAE